MIKPGSKFRPIGPYNVHDDDIATLQENGDIIVQGVDAFTGPYLWATITPHNPWWTEWLSVAEFEYDD